jgi:hypothetical protein
MDNLKRFFNTNTVVLLLCVLCGVIINVVAQNAAAVVWVIVTGVWASIARLAQIYNEDDVNRLTGKVDTLREENKRLREKLQLSQDLNVTLQELYDVERGRTEGLRKHLERFHDAGTGKDSSTDTTVKK